MTSTPLTLTACATVIIASVTAAAAAGDRAGFPKNAFSLTTTASYAATIDTDNANVGSAQVGANFFVLDNLSIGAELSGLGFDQTGDDAWALGIAGTARHHFLRVERASLYVDVSFGPAEATRRVPGGGTHFNFITRVGPGVTLPLNDDLHLMAGVRYWHLSNAQIEGARRNPGYDAIETYVGVMWVR